MTITRKTHIKNFTFWGNAEKNVRNFTEEIWDQFEVYFEDVYPHGIDATALNDIFSFDFQEVMSVVLGIDIDEDDD